MQSRHQTQQGAAAGECGCCTVCRGKLDEGNVGGPPPVHQTECHHFTCSRKQASAVMLPSMGACVLSIQ